MKDEFDDVTRDMFEKGPDKKVSNPTGITYVQDKTYGEKAAKSSATKAPGKAPGVSGGGGGGAGIPKVGPKKPMDMKKGGVTRADGCITKGHTKGRMV